MDVPSLINKLAEATRDVSSSDRYSLYPIQDEKTFFYVNKHISTVWTNIEMNYSEDKRDFLTLLPHQRRIVSLILAFFSSADGVILNNLAFRFILEAKTLEEKSFYIVQQFMELIHSEAYSLAINSLISDPEERERLFRAADTHPTVKRKNEFMEKYLFSSLEKPYRLVAFACAEGIFFISAFLIVFWFRVIGKLNVLIFLNEQVSKDETLHRDFAVHLFRMHGAESKKVQDIVREAVEIEIDFIRDVLEVEEEDLTVKQSINYIHRLGNRLLYDMGVEEIFPEEGELPTWMQNISRQQKANLYEVRGGNYRTRGAEDFNYAVDDDF